MNLFLEQSWFDINSSAMNEERRLSKNDSVFDEENRQRKLRDHLGKQYRALFKEMRQEVSDHSIDDLSVEGYIRKHQKKWHMESHFGSKKTEYGHTESTFQPTLYSYLSFTDFGFKGAEATVDVFGRTALIAACDPEYWSKMNEEQMEVLHSIDTLENIAYAGGSWKTKDKRGLSADEVCPDWLREVFDSIYQRLGREKG